MRLKKDKSGDTVGRPSCRSSLLGDPGAKFFSGKPQHMKNSLNFANTCLKVVDTRRIGLLLIRALLRRTASQRNKDMRENQQHETQLHATLLTKWILHPRNEALQADSQSS